MRQHAVGRGAQRGRAHVQQTRCLPSFPVPQGHDEDSFLRELVTEGAKERYGTAPQPNVIERIEFELDVIKSMGFSAYFLVVWDLVRYAKSRGIRVGPGRGSAAGSCVAFCLRIVDIDPIRYDLLFERFLNPGRKQMPDIDMDFDSRYRGEMIKYAAAKYGSDRVAQIITFSTIKLGPRVRDAARVSTPVCARRQGRQGDAAVDHGTRHALRYCFEPSRSTPTVTRWPMSCARCTTRTPTSNTSSTWRAVSKGCAARRHPRCRRGAHTRSADRLPARPAQPEPGMAFEGRASRHAVRDARRRGAGLLKMDFLGLRNLDVMEIRARPRRTLDGDPTRHRQRFRSTTTKNVRDVAARRHHRRLPARRRADAPRLIQRLAPTSFEDVAALVGALPPRPDGAELAQRVRRPQERP